MNSTQSKYHNPFAQTDKILLWIYFILVIFGWMNIYAAVYDETHHNLFDLQTNYGRQMIWIAASFVIAIMILLTDVKIFNSFAFLIYGIFLFLLILVLFIGKEISGSKSWLQIGSLSLQPGEFAKFATCLALASYLGNIKRNFSKTSVKIVAASIILIPALIILAQNETGSALVFLSFIFVLFREGLSVKVLIAAAIIAVLFVLALVINKYILIGLCALILILFYLSQRNRKKLIRITIGIFIAASSLIFSVDYVFHNVLQPHQRIRINVLLGKETDKKGAGYNVYQSMIAIGSGGFWGKGFLKGTQTKYNYVPKQSTDFIFCTIGEEWGFMGSLVVIGLYVGLMLRILQLAERQRSAFSRIYGYGVASLIFAHFAINIGMTIGLLPVIGIPLPFVSYGGSSILAFSILLFVFIKLDAHRHDII
ncbi:MAG TPA: rod shape-determining protein RodA [Bacteroidales bacterium]|jgi:rod shape determining protein RodA|nr:rod shape-determining protein RodA [Bacteroidales bacterium]HQQ01501.1 rod shape-determining protein RodA [Bacteroidales bacterium]